MRLLLSMAAVALAVAAAVGAPAARAEDCQSLWIERNTYYKEAGYCFKTPPAIRHFGNQGCYIDNEAEIRFQPSVWARIQQIRRIERAMGCPA
jgi:hypothetical protein